MRFEGKGVLVTGGATGIGRAAAIAFAREGAFVTIGDINPEAEATVGEIAAKGGEARFVRTDVASKREVDALVAEAVQPRGRLHAAFNNAGIYPQEQAFADFDETAFDRTIAINLKGVFLCCQAEIRAMLARGGGAIVNTASVGGVIANPNMGPYIASKHGVVGLTRAAAIEYARRHIRVNCICPGLVRTPMTEPWFHTPGFMEAFLPASPIGRSADPAEMAGMVLHLCSEEASFTNGSIIIMDGGQTAI